MDKHRKDNAAQESRQCKEKTKDTKQEKTRTKIKTNKPSTQPRPKPNSRPGPRTGKKQGQNADTTSQDSAHHHKPTIRRSRVHKTSLDCNTREDNKILKKRQENTSYLRGRHRRRRTRRRDNIPLRSRRRNKRDNKKKGKHKSKKNNRNGSPAKTGETRTRKTTMAQMTENDDTHAQHNNA